MTRAAPKRKYERSTMTEEELLNLPVSVDLVTAGRAFSIGRTKAHDLARAGEFPCRVLRLGREYRVPRIEILRALGMEPLSGDEEAQEADLAETA